MAQKLSTDKSFLINTAKFLQTLQLILISWYFLAYTPYLWNLFGHSSCRSSIAACNFISFKRFTHCSTCRWCIFHTFHI